MYVFFIPFYDCGIIFLLFYRINWALSDKQEMIGILLFMLVVMRVCVMLMVTCHNRALNHLFDLTMISLKPFIVVLARARVWSLPSKIIPPSTSIKLSRVVAMAREGSTVDWLLVCHFPTPPVIPLDFSQDAMY